MKDIKLKGEKIVLRRLRRADSESLARHGNDKLVSRYLRSTFPSPYRTKDAQEFIRRTHGNWRSGEAQQFGIELRETGEIIGMMSLVNIRKHARQASIGYWIGRKYWRGGVGSEALRLLLDYGFTKLKLNRISACVFGPNKASQKMLEKAGFKKEGVLRQHIRRGNKYWDQLEHGILKKEYKANK